MCLKYEMDRIVLGVQRLKYFYFQVRNIKIKKLSTHCKVRKDTRGEINS